MEMIANFTCESRKYLHDTDLPTLKWNKSHVEFLQNSVGIRYCGNNLCMCLTVKSFQTDMHANYIIIILIHVIMSHPSTV